MAAITSASKQAQDARAAFNIKVLRRHDSTIANIVHSTSFVVLYNFEAGAWTKSGIEGPMFLYERQAGVVPKNGLFVLNRNGVDNYAADIAKDDELDVSDDFLIFKSASASAELGDDADGGEEDEDDGIIGIWVFEKDQRQIVGERLQDLLAQAQSESSNFLLQDSSLPSSSNPAAPSASNSLSLDALFASASPQASSSAAAPLQSRAPEASLSTSSSANQHSSNGRGLLDAIFKSASPSPSPQQAAPPQPSQPPQGANTSMPAPTGSTASNGSAADSASASLMAMLGLNTKPSGVEPRSPSSSTAPSMSAGAGLGHESSAPKAEAQPTLPPPPTEALVSNGDDKVSAPSVDPTAAAAASASAETPAMQQIGSGLLLSNLPLDQLDEGLSKTQLMREILSLIHTDPDFVSRVYQGYQDLVRRKNGA